MKTRHLLPPLLLATLLGIAPSPLLAQPSGRARLTGEQRLLYEQAKEAYVAQEYQASIDLLSQALVLGEVDLFYFGLGRAYFKTGQCKNAQRSYTRARAAPRTDVDLGESIDKGLSQLQDACPGTVSIQCKDPGTMVAIDEKEPVTCPTQALELAPGPHTLTASLGPQTQTLDIQVRALELTTTALTLSAQVSPASTAPVPQAESALKEVTAPAESASPWRTVGLWSMASGAALVVTALVLEVTLVKTARDTFEQQRFTSSDEASLDKAWNDFAWARNTTLVTGGIGAAAAITGAIVFLNTDAPQEQGMQGGMTSWVGANQAGVGWRWVWP